MTEAILQFSRKKFKIPDACWHFQYFPTSYQQSFKITVSGKYLEPDDSFWDSFAWQRRPKKVFLKNPETKDLEFTNIQAMIPTLCYNKHGRSFSLEIYALEANYNNGG